MKKFQFFTDDFLTEVQAQRAELFRQIELPEQALTPVNFSHEEKQVAMLYANRLTWLLYQGGRIKKDDFINDSYILWHHTEDFISNK